MSKILFLEDDEVLFSTIKEYLELEGFSVVGAKNGEEAIELTFNESFDLYLLDINVPLLSGYEFLKELRESGDNTPAFFLTALNDIDTIAKAFDIGASDYIKKPFDIDELIIRIKAQIKSSYSALKYKNIEYEPLKQIVVKNGKSTSLSQVEIKIFDLLIKNSGVVVTKEQFFEVMNRESSIALRVHINKLKSKLDLDIENIRGVGYRLETV